MVDVALQLYTLRALEQPLPDLLDAVGAAGYDGVEFAYRIREAPFEETLAALDRNGLDVASAHVSLDALETEYDDIVALHDRLGTGTLVIPWFDPDQLGDVESVAALADRLNALVEGLAGDGFRLAYHNHDGEFARLSGVDRGDQAHHADHTILDELLARTDDRLGFETDVGWAAVGGADPVALLERYGDRITHVHAADASINREASVAFGEGDVDFESVIAAATVVGAEWLVYEHDDPDDPGDSIRRGATGLRDVLQSTDAAGKDGGS